MKTDYRLVLIEHIHDYEKDGWVLVSSRVHCMIGGWHSVWMKRETESDQNV